MRKLLAVTCLLLAWSCSAAQRAAEQQRSDAFIDAVCAERAALKAQPDAPLVVTDGCATDASDAYVKCVGKNQ